MKIEISKQQKKSWQPFKSGWLNSTANPAQFGWKWAGLAVQVTTGNFQTAPTIFSFFQDFFY